MSNDYSIPSAAQAQEYLAAIVASSDDAIISKDMNGNITSWNPAAERIFGYTASEAVGKHISLLIPADKIREEDYILGQIRQGKRVDHFETLRRAKDGRMVNVSVTVSPIRDTDGTIVGASKIARDITDIRQAERAGAYLSAIIESSDDAIVSKDLNGFITSWNKSAERIFGYTAEEVIGRHITVIIPPDRLHEEDQIIGKLKAGNRVEHFETIRRHKDGHMVNISLSVSPIRDNAGNLVGASKVSRDITERIRTEEALKESSRKKDEFLANMSHELRTPMNAVIGLASLLQSLEGLPERGKKYVETLKVSADNLMDLINDLLDFSKIEANSFEIESIEFNLAEQVEKVISVANVKAREKGLDLYVNFPPTLNRYYVGDPLRVHQILMNVVSNAIKFTEKGSVEVDISGSPDSTDSVTVIVMKISDTGIGIPRSKIDSIFEKFTQADTSMTRKYGGSGLGLAIVKASVEKMHGRIEVESEVGVGTTFIVSLPLRNTGKTSTVESFSASTSPSVPEQKRDVLLVEDYAPNVMVASAMLDQFGYNYDIAHNGFEALRKFVHGHYDVILMDVQMNELDGLEATRRIRRIENEKGLPRTPIVAMTAHVREQDKEKCYDAGMDDFVPKPFEPRLLAQKIERYISMNKELNNLEMQAKFRKKDQE